MKTSRFFVHCFGRRAFAIEPARRKLTTRRFAALRRSGTFTIVDRALDDIADQLGGPELP